MYIVLHYDPSLTGCDIDGEFDGQGLALALVEHSLPSYGT